MRGSPLEVRVMKREGLDLISVVLVAKCITSVMHAYCGSAWYLCCMHDPLCLAGIIVDEEAP